MSSTTKLLIADYIGNSLNNKPIGHPKIILSQMIEVFKGSSFNQTYCVPKPYVEFLVGSKHNNLPFAINVDTNNHILNRILNITKKIINLYIIFRTKSNSIILYNIDKTLYLYLYLFGRNRNQKLVIISYMDFSEKSSAIALSLYRKTMHLVDVELNSYDLNSNNYLPDYYFKKNNIKSVIKNDSVVIIGTMIREKQLGEVCNSINSIQLSIIGKFYENEYFQEIIGEYKDKKNIIIKNQYLSDSEYVKTIYSNKYLLISNVIDHYSNRTSGVFFDAIFNDAIPIVPKSEYFLKFQHEKICLYYDSIDNIEHIINQCHYQEVIMNIQKFKERFSFENYQEKIFNAIKY